jgi:uncharacterized DUF497 family protein
MIVLKPIRFDWDNGNLEHTTRHGVSPAEIEYLFTHDPMVSPDPYPVNVEERWRAIGKNEDGRYVFVVFMFRTVEDELSIRPISARYMHGKEIESYERR